MITHHYASVFIDYLSEIYTRNMRALYKTNNYSPNSDTQCSAQLSAIYQKSLLNKMLLSRKVAKSSKSIWYRCQAKTMANMRIYELRRESTAKVTFAIHEHKKYEF